MDQNKFINLAELEKKKLYAIAYRIVRNDADASDAVSAGILHAYENINSLKDMKKFSSWLSAIVKNEAINIIRTRKKDETLWQHISQSLPGEDSQRKELNAVIENLPDDCRDEMILHYYCGLSHKEIADVRQIPLGTVKSRIHRGRQILRKEFQINELTDTSHAVPTSKLSPPTL